MSTFIEVLLFLIWMISISVVVIDMVKRFRKRRLKTLDFLWLPLVLLLGPMTLAVYTTEQKLEDDNDINQHIPVHKTHIDPQRRRQQQAFIWPSRGFCPPKTENMRPLRQRDASELENTKPPSSTYYLAVVGMTRVKPVNVPIGAWLIARRGEETSANSNELRIRDAGVSRKQHFRIGMFDNKLMLEDTSSYGTHVNGQLINGKSIVLEDGYKIKVGRTNMIVQDENKQAETHRN